MTSHAADHRNLSRNQPRRREGACVHSSPAIRLLDELPSHPVVTLPAAMKVLQTTKPTAAKALDALRTANVLVETTGKQRDRVYAYKDYLALLTGDTE